LSPHQIKKQFSGLLEVLDRIAKALGYRRLWPSTNTKYFRD